MTAARSGELGADQVSCRLGSPFGQLRLTANDRAIIGLTWSDGSDAAPDREAADHPLLAKARAQLEEYFTGTRQIFDLPLDPPGSDFQKSVCHAMLDIPHGQTRTYGDLARQLGVAAQPVGQGCGGNPIPIIIPCHRVMAADGKLGGFSGGRGAETKLALLRHEGALLL